MDIAKPIIEQQNKMHNEYAGGYYYGHDYNILKAILENIKQVSLVKDLIKGLKDRSLAEAVMAGEG